MWFMLFVVGGKVSRRRNARVTAKEFPITVIAVAVDCRGALESLSSDGLLISSKDVPRGM